MYHSSITADAVASKSIQFPIPGFPHYYADVDGAIWSTKQGTMKRLSPKVCKNGYLMVRLHTVSGPRHRYVHQLILETFRGPRPDPLAVAAHHPDPDKANCAVTNLVWTDRKTNAAHWLATNPVVTGGPKLDASKVKELRRLHAAGWKNAALAKRYGVGLDAIRCVLTGHTWSHVP